MTRSLSGAVTLGPGVRAGASPAGGHEGLYARTAAVRPAVFNAAARTVNRASLGPAERLACAP